MLEIIIFALIPSPQPIPEPDASLLSKECLISRVREDLDYEEEGVNPFKGIGPGKKSFKKKKFLLRKKPAFNRRGFRSSKRTSEENGALS